MKYIRLSRAVGGLLSVICLLGVLVAHVLIPSVETPPWVVMVMLTLIGGLLAVDVFQEEFPMLTISFEKDNE